ncbi:MAG: ATP-binding cassette domain-containing protein [Ktedonobacteraceae bacterium]|jgi:ABC-type sugar transport system ATPase subunit
MRETQVPDTIRVEHIAKSYGAVKALRDINMHLMKGEVLGLLGDNGAGKSTLIKILTGFIQPDDGKIFVNEEEVKLRSVTYARSLGIETVYQDLALANELTVYHNMFLNREVVLKPLPFLNNRVMREQAREALDKIGVRIPSVDATVAKLSGGQRQAIAIARAVNSNAKILLLDEPLAAMGAKEGALILDLIRRLRASGEISIIMIAHNYAQVLEICDRINMLQHGTITFDKRTTDTSLQELNEIVMREYRTGAASQE